MQICLIYNRRISAKAKLKAVLLLFFWLNEVVVIVMSSSLLDIIENSRVKNSRLENDNKGQRHHGPFSLWPLLSFSSLLFLTLEFSIISNNHHGGRSLLLKWIDDVPQPWKKMIVFDIFTLTTSVAIQKVGRYNSHIIVNKGQKSTLL